MDDDGDEFQIFLSVISVRLMTPLPALPVLSCPVHSHSHSAAEDIAGSFGMVWYVFGQR